MPVADVFEKTQAGVEEVRVRARKLPPRLRTMLIMVDGVMPTPQLLEAAATLGVPGDFLESLQSQGLIQRRSAQQAAEQSLLPTPAAAAEADPAQAETRRFLAAQKFMNDSAVDALGLMSFWFTLKLEKCFTVTDLRNLLPDYAKAIAKKSGETAAQVLVQRARQLLG